jgi:D-aspartate ligase
MPSDISLAPSALVIGLGTNGLAVVRSLARYGVSVLVLLGQQDQETPEFCTRYGKKIVLPVLDWPSVMDFLQKLDAHTIIFPTLEAIVTQLAHNRHCIPDRHTVILPDAAVVRLLQDKVLFDSFAREQGLVLPESRELESSADVARIAAALRFPLIVKPVKKIHGSGLAKAYIVQNLEELQRIADRVLAEIDSCIVQEFIPGDDHHIYFCLQYISQNGELLASFTGRKIRQWPPLSGGTASCEPVYAPELHEMTHSFFASAGFWGIGSMEYKKDPRDGRYVVIEPTVGRTDFQEGVAIANGVNIPYTAYRDILGESVRPIIGNDGNKAWMHFTNDRLAAGRARESGELTMAAWLYSLRHVRCFNFFSLSDPGPSFAFCKTVLKNRLFPTGK